MSKSDPIRARYFKPVETFDFWGGVLFYVGALLSFALLLVDKTRHAEPYQWLLVAFGVASMALLVVGMVSRLYLIPRAEDKRRLDFFTNAFGVPLTHEQTAGYYNNDLTDHTKRVAAQVLENSLFSKRIANEMLRDERIKVSLYAVLWVVFLLNRRTDLGVLVAVLQVIFSEEILARWLRLEFIRRRFETTFDDVYSLFQTGPAPTQFNALALDALTMYETTKAMGGIVLSANVFERLNPELSAEWDQIKATLKI